MPAGQIGIKRLTSHGNDETDRWVAGRVKLTVRRRKAVSGHLASVCNHSPDDAGALLAVVRPSLQKDVVGNIVGADAERVLNDLAASS